MSLVPFHKGLITAGILFCAGFSAWTFLAYRRDGATVMLALAIVFWLLAIGLVLYLRNLRRFLGLPDAGKSDGPADRR